MEARMTGPVTAMLALVAAVGCVLFAVSYVYAGPKGKVGELLKRLLTLLASLALVFAVGAASTWVFLRFGSGTMQAGMAYIREELCAEGFDEVIDAAQDISGKWYLNHTQQPDLVLQFSLPQEEWEKLEWTDPEESGGHHNSWFWPEFLGAYGLAAVENSDHYHTTHCGRARAWGTSGHPHIFYTFAGPDALGMVEVYYVSTYS